MAGDQPSIGGSHAQRAEQAMLADKPISNRGVLAERPILPTPAGLAGLNGPVEIIGTCASNSGTVAAPSLAVVWTCISALLI